MIHKSQRKLYKGQHDAIINDELWRKVKTTFNEPKNQISRVTIIPLLKGLIRCDICKVSMQPICIKKNYCYYICRSHIQGLDCKCILAAGEIENVIMKEISEEKREQIKQIIKSLWIGDSGIKICYSEDESVFILVQFKKRGARRIIINPTEEREVDNVVQKALVKAYFMGGTNELILL